MITRTATGYRTGGRVFRHPDRQIILAHGDPFAATLEAALGAQVRAVSTMCDGLHATGHQVAQPWLAATWGTDVNAYDTGGHGISVIDTLYPSGPVHLIGWSMGGYTLALWAAQHPERVASLTLVSPALDIVDIFTRLQGNAILDGITTEIATCWAGDPDADETTVAAAVTAADADIDSLTTALAPLADRIWIVCATDDKIGLAPVAQTFAAALDLPADRAVFFDSDSETNHPAPYRETLGWDQITTLRQVEAWA